MERLFVKLLALSISTFVFLTLTQCASKATPSVALPKDILGISIGMSKTETEQHLREVGQLERIEVKHQEVWVLPKDTRYSRVALGYDADDKIRYVTAFARHQENVTQIRYEDFGDLKTARQNVFLAGKEYVWEVPAQNENPGFFIIIRGNDPIYALTASLMKSGVAAKESEEDED